MRHGSSSTRRALSAEIFLRELCDNAAEPNQANQIGKGHEPVQKRADGPYERHGNHRAHENERRIDEAIGNDAFGRRCCTALAESEIRLWWWPRYVSSMKYPKRCQYKHAKQKKYHVRNWAEYNEGLRRRGDLTVWFDEEAIANWKADKTGKPGGQRVYSDMAIETGLVVRMVYKLSGYTKRSMVENAVYRYKAIIGPEMRARTLARQRVEHRIGCEILNKMAALGMPDTYCAG